MSTTPDTYTAFAAWVTSTKPWWVTDLSRYEGERYRAEETWKAFESFAAGRGSVVAPAEPVAPLASEPMFWVRLCSDGMYEGPIHHAQIEKVRQQSGAWHPLYLAAPPAPAPQPEPLQGGMTNTELLAAWVQKLPRVAPTDKELTAFALGIEVGFSRRAALAAQWPREAEDRVNQLLGEVAAKELECQRLREAVRPLEAVPPAPQSEWLTALCRYLSDTLAAGTPNERTVARTVMRMLPLAELATAKESLQVAPPPVMQVEIQADPELLCRVVAAETEVLLLRAASTQQEPAAVPELIGFLSPEQVSRIADPEDESGVYMPMRKTARGKFTLAVYTHPTPQPAPTGPEAERAAGVPAGMVPIGWGVRASIDPPQASALWTARPAPDDIAFMESSGGVRVVVEPVYMAAAPQPANPATGQGTLPHTEPLTWHRAAGPKLPDADATCILWIRYSDGTEDWESGWLDGDGWRLCESGGLVEGEVLFWAQPGGPAC